MPTTSTSDVPPPTDMTPVTGIARGNLGTATNLDDTQVYALDELRAAAAAAAIPGRTAAPASAPAKPQSSLPAPVVPAASTASAGSPASPVSAVPPADAPAGWPDSAAPGPEFPVAPAADPMPVRQPEPRPRPQPVRSRVAVMDHHATAAIGNRGRRTGLLAAAAVAAILGAAVLLTVRDGTLGGPGSGGADSGAGAVVVPSSVVPTEPAPTAPPAGGGGNGHGNGNGHGKGNGHGD